MLFLAPRAEWGIAEGCFVEPMGGPGWDYGHWLLSQLSLHLRLIHGHSGSVEFQTREPFFAQSPFCSFIVTHLNSSFQGMSLGQLKVPKSLGC